MEPEQLLETLFPNGLSLAQAAQYPQIKAAAKRLCDVVDGKVPAYNQVRTPEESEQITRRVVEMRKAGREWKDISAEVKIGVTGCKKRYGEANALERIKAEVNKEVESEITSEAFPNCSKRQEEATKQPQSSYETGHYPRSFEEAPIESALKPVEPGRNKYNRWEEPVTDEVDAEIARMDREGLDCRQISGELAKKNIFMTFQRVRGRIALMAKKANKKPKDEGKTPEVQSIQTSPEKARAEESQCIASKSEISTELGERIKKLDVSGLTPTGISDQLYEDDGTVLSADEISCYLYDIARGLKK